MSMASPFRKSVRFVNQLLWGTNYHNGTSWSPSTHAKAGLQAHTSHYIQVLCSIHREAMLRGLEGDCMRAILALMSSFVLRSVNRAWEFWRMDKLEWTVREPLAQ